MVAVVEAVNRRMDPLTSKKFDTLKDKRCWYILYTDVDFMHT